MTLFLLIVASVICFANGDVLVGGPSQVTDLSVLKEIKSIARNSLAGLNSDDKRRASLEVDHLLSATSQVVSGIRYDAVFIVLENREKVKCNFSIWVQSWDDFQEVQIDCEKPKRMSRCTENGKPTASTCLINATITKDGASTKSNSEWKDLLYKSS